ncbi:MAG: hypothetical protein ABI556_01215 [Gemmatimonadales bacterium]
MNSASVRTSARFARFAALTLSGLILAAGTQPNRSLYAQGGAHITGAGISKVGRDTRKLTVQAQAPAGSASASGTVQFIHNSPAGLSRFRGTITCVSVNGGTAQISGLIEKGETATGALLDGKAYAITISTGSPQSFSLPTIGEPGAVGACSGGRGETVPVTEDGFKIG